MSFFFFLFLNMYISIANVWIFLWWIEIEPSFSSMNKNLELTYQAKLPCLHILLDMNIVREICEKLQGYLLYVWLYDFFDIARRSFKSKMLFFMKQKSAWHSSPFNQYIELIICLNSQNFLICLWHSKLSYHHLHNFHCAQKTTFLVFVKTLLKLF